MGMDRLLPAFMDELEKIAVSLRLSSFRKGRGGRRPIRVHNLMKKETAFLPHRSPLKKKEHVLDETGRDTTPATVSNRQQAEMESGMGMQESGM